MFWNTKIDYLVVGAGLSGAVFAQQMKESGRSVQIIDKRNHIGGNAFTKKVEGIDVHVYGPHLFRTKNKAVWDYVNKYAEFNNYQHIVKAKFKNKVYNLPFNLSTFNQFWGCTTPAEAIQELNKRKAKIANPQNLEEFALSQVGEEIYHTLIYGYTKKQWNREPRRLPASIIKRIPVRFEYDDRYYADPYQGIPVKGYTEMVQNILGDTEIKLNTDFRDIKKSWRSIAKKLVYTGPLDELFDYQFGPLEYRSLEFNTIVVDGTYQGIGQMNYTSADIPYTRTIEHKMFNDNAKSNAKSIVTFEYPANWQIGKEPYYPINDAVNEEKHKKYKALIPNNVLTIGRLASYKYINMDASIAMALNAAKAELK